MAWEARQNRLRTLFGAKETLCFQVFCEVYQKGVTAKEFDELVKQHGIVIDDEFSVKNLPRPSIGQITFRPGFLYIDKDGQKGGSQVNVQSVFTSTNNKLVKFVAAYYKKAGHTSLSNPILDEIMGSYIPQIERQLPHLSFAGKRYIDVEGFSVEFKFGIQPYKFDLHPPRDMDTLKPITIINGHTIHPTKNISDGFDKTLLRQFTL